jgi:hypothetical protein
MANWLAGVTPYLALHSADPGPTGLYETTATRVAAAWPAATGGVLLIVDKRFSGGEPLGPATHVGLWSALTGGTFYGSGALLEDQTFNAVGSFTIVQMRIRPLA